MAQVKYLKYPKKPAKSASIAVKERYLSRCDEIDKINKDRRKEAEYSDKLDGIISSKTTHPTKHLTTVTQRYSRSKPVSRKTGVSGTKRKATKRKTTKRKATRRR